MGLPTGSRRWSLDILSISLPFFIGNFVGNFVEFRMLTHDRLKVYQKALALGAQAEAFSAHWGRRHAIVDQFRRAAESTVLNIAEAARRMSGPDKVRTLDDAIGSSLSRKGFRCVWKPHPDGSS